MGAARDALKALIPPDPRRDNCPLCRAMMDLALYGQTRETPEEQAKRTDDLCGAHKADIDGYMADVLRGAR